MSDETHLTVREKTELGNLEQVIEQGIRTFAEVGTALQMIRDGRLYRASHGTFEAYCRERWGFKKSRAYQLMDAAQVAENVHERGQIEPPPSEWQARPLTKLPPEQQADAWEEANERAESEGRNVTAKDVETVVAEIRGPAPTETYLVSDAEQFVNTAIRQLQRIRNDDPNAERELDRVSAWVTERKRELWLQGKNQS